MPSKCKFGPIIVGKSYEIVVSGTIDGASQIVIAEFQTRSIQEFLTDNQVVFTCFLVKNAFNLFTLKLNMR